MNTGNLNASEALFVRNVTAAFALAEVISVLPMTGSANRLWQFTTTSGIFVVKELPYNDQTQYADLRQAANFEALLIGEQRVPGPIPVPNRNGEYVSVLTDSRAKESPVRVHRWFTGTPPRVDDPVTLVQAGRTLRTIQLAGASCAVRPNGFLVQWHRNPNSLLEQFLASGHCAATATSQFRSTITDAVALVRAGEALSGDWVYTHRDHKPENCLSHDGVLAVLDWDECNYCHPRLEAVESALRWAGSEEPKPETFRAFINGYNEAGALLETLCEQDFAKWIAGLLEWFCFQARRAVGEWPEITTIERTIAAEWAYDALLTLQSSLTALSRWTRLL